MVCPASGTAGAVLPVSDVTGVPASPAEGEGQGLVDLGAGLVEAVAGVLLADVEGVVRRWLKRC